MPSCDDYKNLFFFCYFQFEAEIESTVGGDLYVCGAYLRYGNDIYAYSYCGGVFIDGLIFGDGYYIPNTFNDYVSEANNFYFLLFSRLVKSQESTLIGTHVYTAS